MPFVFCPSGTKEMKKKNKGQIAMGSRNLIFCSLKGQKEKGGEKKTSVEGTFD